MKSFSRFQPPRAEDEFYDCAGCGEKFYYTALDKHGECPQCRKDSYADYLEELEKDRRGRVE